MGNIIRIFSFFFIEAAIVCKFSFPTGCHSWYCNNRNCATQYSTTAIFCLHVHLITWQIIAHVQFFVCRIVCSGVELVMGLNILSSNCNSLGTRKSCKMQISSESYLCYFKSIHTSFDYRDHRLCRGFDIEFNHK